MWKACPTATHFCLRVALTTPGIWEWQAYQIQIHNYNRFPQLKQLLLVALIVSTTTYLETEVFPRLS